MVTRSSSPFIVFPQLPLKSTKPEVTQAMEAKLEEFGSPFLAATKKNYGAVSPHRKSPKILDLKKKMEAASLLATLFESMVHFHHGI